jgi:hypothetical protein
MPVLKKEIELTDGTKIWVRQASGMEKLKIENIQARVFRKLKHFGNDPTEWTPEQHEEFAVALDEAGGGMETQIETWLPKCIMSEDFDVNMLNSEEVRMLLQFIRGDTLEGAVPLG